MSGTGRAGQTHCGSWIKVEPCSEYNYRTRLVCTRKPHSNGYHATPGWWWSIWRLKPQRGRMPNKTPPSPH